MTTNLKQTKTVSNNQTGGRLSPAPERKSYKYKGSQTIDVTNRLEKVSIKEIIDKYPDLVCGVIQRNKDTVLVLSKCKIIFRK